jgi:hypothetical protein
MRLFKIFFKFFRVLENPYLTDTTSGIGGGTVTLNRAFTGTSNVSLFVRIFM